MEGKLSKREVFFVGLMLFCMFFGAGNLIFPPFLGEMAGKNVWIAFCGFIISAVGLPILSVIIVSKSNGLNALAGHVNGLFAVVFTILIYLSIGPFLGIPRTGSLSYQMTLAPFLSGRLSKSPLPLFLFTLVYFLLALWLSLTPSKLVDRLGKLLTPILLAMIAGVFVCSLFKPMGSFGAAKGDYVAFPFFKGFSEGYLTMDAIAGLNFGIVISTTLKNMGVKKEKSIISYSTKAGLIVGVLLMVNYAMLAYIGASSRAITSKAQNGADVLTSVFLFLFGKYGTTILGILFSLACFTTAVGLITSCGEYFASIVPKVPYKAWVCILSFWSMVTSNVGLTKILAISVPVLNAIYPMAIVLMLLFVFRRLFGNSTYVYRCCMLFTAVFSIADSLNSSVMKLSSLSSLFSYFPLYSQGMGWIVPGLLGAFLGYAISLFSKQNFAENEGTVHQNY